MSRPHDAHRNHLLSFPNPFRIIRPKRFRSSHISRKLTTLLISFEQSLAQILLNLKPKDLSETLTLEWMEHAIDCLSEAHANITTLITDLQFPLSDWEEKWMDIYLDSSVKLLDICLGLSAELSRLDQSKLLINYTLHVLGSPNCTTASAEQIKRVQVLLRDWIGQIGSRSAKLETCPDILTGLREGMFLGKVKDSAKGKVLLRALYGVKAITILVGSALASVLLGSSRSLIELNMCNNNKFSWWGAFTEVQSAVYGEIRLQVSEGRERVSMVREVESIESSVRRLCGELELRGEENGIGKEEGERKELVECVRELRESGERFTVGLDSVSKRVGDFFEIVLTGRDALLCNLRVSNGCGVDELKS